jgi:hypothetical protein
LPVADATLDLAGAPGNDGDELEHAYDDVHLSDTFPNLSDTPPLNLVTRSSTESPR